eukprot:3936157-Prymnesium_polylepis.2
MLHCTNSRGYVGASGRPCCGRPGLGRALPPAGRSRWHPATTTRVPSTALCGRMRTTPGWPGRPPDCCAGWRVPCSTSAALQECLERVAF